MSTPYFRQVPNFEYVSRTAGEQNISDYVAVKNLFKRGKLRDDIIDNLAYFTKYSILGDERPDQVAFKFYGEETLDWVVLLSNNILNIQTEWPMPQVVFDKFLINKYGSYENIDAVHHYETIEVKNNNGIIVLPKGLQVDQNYSITYYDAILEQEVTKTNITEVVTNFQYEDKLQDNKRNIFILKPDYLNTIFNDLETVLTYQQGATQYVSRTLKKGDNIRLYE
jgi:hypothetical protein